MDKILELKYKDPVRKLDMSGKMEIKNSTSDSADLYFYGDIVPAQWAKWSDDDKAPQDIVDFLKEVEGVSKLNMFLNSGGGECFSGFAIRNILKRNKAYKTARVDGLSASIAVTIMFAADETIVTDLSQIMIHKPWSWNIGNAFDLRKTADELDLVESQIIDDYMAHAKEGVTRETIQQLVNEEKWFTGKEAAEIFNIKVESGTAAAACASGFFSLYQKTPSGLLVKKEPDNPPPVVNEAEKEKLLLEIDLL